MHKNKATRGTQYWLGTEHGALQSGQQSQASTATQLGPLDMPHSPCTASRSQPTCEACSLSPGKPPMMDGQPCLSMRGAKAIKGTNDRDPITRPAAARGTPCSPCLRSTSCTAGWTGWSPGGSPDTGRKTWGKTWAEGWSTCSDVCADHTRTCTHNEHSTCHPCLGKEVNLDLPHPPTRPCCGLSKWGMIPFQRAAAGSPDSLAPNPYDMVVHQAQEEIEQAAAGLVQRAALEK